MKTNPLLLVTAMASGLIAQSNTVAGLDGRLTQLDDPTYFGRRGPAYPNGEVGMAVLNEMCNPGSVVIPWMAAMQPNHPKFGFLVVRVVDDRLEQISDRSFCKHAFTSVNYSGPCGSCQNPGTGTVMGINCADAYGAGNNGDRTWLGPADEIDPWLGTWNPVGSYFDIGDPQTGIFLPPNGVRSLITSGFDAVKNRVTLQEADLQTPGASYFYGIHLIHQGEALANRGDNLASRGLSPAYNAGTWSFSNNAVPQSYGSILQQWPGATVESGHNGNDDGRFFVASKVTSLGGGQYHYEYAVHNCDNNRGGASFRLPIAATAVASNFTFRDIDSDPLDSWIAARVGNEIVFTAPANNPLNWNTIYNFGFDANFPPGTGACEIDEARMGPGALSVSVPTEVPGGQTIATFTTFGTGCAGSTQIPTPPCAEWNPTGGALTLQTSPNEYCYRVNTSTAVQVLSFDIWTASTGGTVTVPAHIYGSAGTAPAATPLASTTLTVGPTQGFYTATFAVPVSVSGTYYLGVDSSAQTVYLDNLTAGSVFLAYSRTSGAAPWTLSVFKPSWIVSCLSAQQYEVPALDTSALPILGTSYDVTLDHALASTFAVLVSGLSDSVYPGGTLPAGLPGAPGCDVLVAPDVLSTALTAANGTASLPIAVPNSASLNGLAVFHQWAVLDPTANTLGLVTSNGGRVTVGN